MHYIHISPSSYVRRNPTFASVGLEQIRSFGMDLSSFGEWRGTAFRDIAECYYVYCDVRNCTTFYCNATVLSLLRHGPNIMLYPGAFEPKPRSEYIACTSYTACSFTTWHASHRLRHSGALLPSTWGLKFENLTLVTSDKVNLHAYMLPQPDAKLKPRKTAYDYIVRLSQLQSPLV